MRKGQNSREVSPLFRHQMSSVRDREKARTLKTLLEANAKWNTKWRESARNYLRRTLDDASTINPHLRKELLHSWERGFVEDKLTPAKTDLSPNLPCKDENRKSGTALTNPLKGNVVSGTSTTDTTAERLIYRKSNITSSKIPITGFSTSGTKSGQKVKMKSPLEENETKHQRQEIESPLESESEEETRQQQQENQAEKLFQNSDTVVTSKETSVGGGPNLAVKRAKINHREPASVGPKSQEKMAIKPIPKNQSAQEK